MTKKTTPDAVEIIDQEFYQGKPDRQRQVEQTDPDDVIAREIRDLRARHLSSE